MNNWDNIVVRINSTIQNNDFNHPLNKYDTNNISGSGFFISDDLILTCYHVIEGALTIYISFKESKEFVSFRFYPDETDVKN